MHTCSNFINLRFLFFALFMNMLSNTSIAQNENSPSIDSTFQNKRLNAVLVGGSAIYVVSMAGFYELWYKDFETTSFHFFNDNNEWLLMDKVGHVGTSYQLSKWGQKLFIWTGMPERKAAWWGAGVSTLYQSSIEVFDGFSSEWGFSVGDVISNTAGSGIFVAQELLWEEQRIVFKYSFQNSKYPKYRPTLLGQSQVEKLIKDYNGQTIWASANVKSFAFKTSKIPDWLNVSVGYGAEGMITAKENDPIIQELNLPEFNRYRQFYFAPDISLTKIKTDSRVLRTVFDLLEFVKIPMPTLEVDEKGNVKFHALYF